jgi:tetratricopeptide (TPR) repeat protein
MDSYSVLGWSLLQLRRYDEAITYGEQALRLSQHDYRIVEILAEAYFFTGETLKALHYFERYTILNPIGERIKTAYYFMGEIFIQLGEYNHADIAFSTAVYHAPNVATWWARLGYAREMAEEYETSIVAYERALELNPTLQEAKEGLERVQARL